MVKIEIKLSNRWLYTILAIIIVILAGVSVYAVTGVSHDASELTGVCKTNGTGCPTLSQWSGTTTNIYSPTGGKVGIGTSSPDEELEVYGVVYTNAEVGGLIVDSGENKRIGFMKYSGREAGIWRVPGQDFEIGRTTTDLSDDGATPIVDLYIKGTGDVGIGDSSPDAKLDVLNTGSGTSFRVDDSSDGDTTPFIIDAAGDVAIGGDTGGGYKLEVYGSLYATGYSTGIGNPGIDLTAEASSTCQLTFENGLLIRYTNCGA